MKLQTAIVEDQKPDAERLEQLLKKAFGEEEILCRRFVCGDDFLKEFPGEGYQVVFLDICMEGTNGIETARQLRAADPELLIVFVTSSPEYVWDAFPVHPFDYLLKPYTGGMEVGTAQIPAPAGSRPVYHSWQSA